MKKPCLDAGDVLNWDYLCEIAEWIEKPKDWKQGARHFAYRFTSTGDAAKQNVMLSDLLLNATANQSIEAAEDVIESLSTSLNTDMSLLREFAKQCGIKLKKASEEAQ